MRAKRAALIGKNAAIAALFAFTACKRPDKVQSKQSEPRPPPSTFSVRDTLGRIDRPGAFDLAPAPGGAAIVWADAVSKQLFVARLHDETTQLVPVPLAAREGRSNSDARVVVEELSLAARGDELGVAFIEKRGNDWRALAAVRHVSNALGTKYLDLGSVAGPLSAERGNVSVATARSGDLLVLARGLGTECIKTNERACIGFAFYRLERGAAVKRGLPLVVPEPCAQNPTLFTASTALWQYAICSRSSGKPATTLFSIQEEPAYARADPVLDGCAPVSLTRVRGELLAVGDCGGQRRAVRVSSSRDASTTVPLNLVDTACKNGALVIRQPGADGMTLTISEAQSRLEALLPSSVAPPGARAVWTGKRLVVAYPTAGDLFVDRYRCDSSLLRKVEETPE